MRVVLINAYITNILVGSLYAEEVGLGA